MRKSKMALLNKEFDIFTMLKGETFGHLIERYCHLMNEMKRLGIEKPKYEHIVKLADTLPETGNFHYDSTIKPRCFFKIKSSKIY